MRPVYGQQKEEKDLYLVLEIMRSDLKETRRLL